jgi:hypothetical protein
MLVVAIHSNCSSCYKYVRSIHAHFMVGSRGSSIPGDEYPSEQTAVVVTLCSCFREVSGSTFGWITAYSDCGLSGFLRSHETNTGRVPWNRRRPHPSKSLRTHHSWYVISANPNLYKLVKRMLLNNLDRRTNWICSNIKPTQKITLVRIIRV